MLTAIHPKLPMRDRNKTILYYVNGLGFTLLADYGDYLLFTKDQIELHFFAYPTLVPEENDGGVYIRVNGIAAWYQSLLDREIAIHPNGALETKPWGQIEFALLDPDHNLLTFGEEC
jgi:catechol 2,3-dioxygenase-like lactoylglutathione lyase family enzyme